MLDRKSRIQHEWHDLMKVRMWRHEGELVHEELLTPHSSDRHGWAGV